MGRGKRVGPRKAHGTGLREVRATVGVALLLFLLVFLMPVVFLSGRRILPSTPEASQTPGEAQAGDPLPALPTPARVVPMTADLPVRDGSYSDDTVQVRVLMQDGSVFQTPMYDYLWHVVAAEMPAAFEPEALRAQTVAARTYALRKMLSGEPKHPETDVCTDINCCQAFITRAAADALWGDDADGYSKKIAAAVADTAGMVLAYQGEVIDAVFHSSSAGRTADAIEVWGADVPYLLGVDSPEREDEVPNYHTTVTVNADDFRQLMTDLYPDAKLGGNAETWFQNITRTVAGAVDTIEVGGVVLRGTQLRAMCALRSAYFTIRTVGGEIVFDVTAYGHGVGLSQYGANTLAKQGRTWQEIVCWYYTGVEITQLP